MPSSPATAGFSLADVDPDSTPGFTGKKADGEEELAAIGEELSSLQEQLFATSKFGGTRKVLLLLQAMDTAGKGGIVRHVVGAVDPQGVRIKAFKAPTDEEKKHDFLWRVQAEPAAGRDARGVRPLALRGGADPPGARTLDARGGRGALRRHQGVRARGRRRRHGAHQGDAAHRRGRAEGPPAGAPRPARQALEVQPGRRRRACLLGASTWTRTRSRSSAPRRRMPRGTSFPRTHKWYARLAVARLLLDAFKGFDLEWPKAEFDVEVEKARLAAT